MRLSSLSSLGTKASSIKWLPILHNELLKATEVGATILSLFV